MLYIISMYICAFWPICSWYGVVHVHLQDSTLEYLCCIHEHCQFTRYNNYYDLPFHLPPPPPPFLKFLYLYTCRWWGLWEVLWACHEGICSKGFLAFLRCFLRELPHVLITFFYLCLVLFKLTSYVLLTISLSIILFMEHTIYFILHDCISIFFPIHGYDRSISCSSHTGSL